ncbi:hypothetical protein AVEN_18432-1 [Araneus ventricosus]|uniref:Uncharacterized protein n=1 Tax=Araneus ventricosus TaxID=182803 RepID=A0A4Y2G5R7_ARAVE|nr:hypothetical protein AVEN_18432-1 [Araneus ventricosus]
MVVLLITEPFADGRSYLYLTDRSMCSYRDYYASATEPEFTIRLRQIIQFIPEAMAGNTDSQQITNNDSDSTFNSAQLTGFPVRTAHETPKSFFESVRSPFIDPCSTGCYVTWKYLTHSSISSPNGDVEKMIAYSGIFDLSPSYQNGRQVRRQGQESRPGR